MPEARQPATSRRYRLTITAGIVALVGAFAATGIVLVRSNTQQQAVRWQKAAPRGVMGTGCLIRAGVERANADTARQTLAAAEQELRRVEALASKHLADSELSRLNRAPAGRLVPLSDEMLALLRLARELTARTDGAFDPTVGPVIALWEEAQRKDRPPTEEEIKQARAASGWDAWALLDRGAQKRRAEAKLDLGGIAKGYGIDRALQALADRGCAGGLVDVGGDIRCFGLSPREGGWRLGVRDPFHPDSGRLLAVLEVSSEAVCTSGNYFRYHEIAGRRYHHIIDPRSGRPAEAAPSVTVIAPTAARADAWATALSVLGPAGLQIIPPEANIEAMLVVARDGQYELEMTDGFRRFVRTIDAPSPQNAQRR